jgi:hypothetical protein
MVLKNKLAMVQSTAYLVILRLLEGKKHFIYQPDKAGQLPSGILYWQCNELSRPIVVPKPIIGCIHMYC